MLSDYASFRKNLQMCRVCQGDPRASGSCSTCHGVGLRLIDESGEYVWGKPLESFTFRFRRFRERAQAIIKLFLGLSILGCFMGFAYGLLRFELVYSWTEWRFWGQSIWYVSLFWLGCFLSCFFLYYIQAYSSAPQPLPGWGHPVTRRLRKQRFDLTHSTTPALWSVLEQAYELASRLQHREVQPIHLMLAVLLSQAGGIFMTRLGTSFETLRDVLIPLLQRTETGNPTAFSRTTQEILLRAYDRANHGHRKYLGVVELFLATFEAEPLLPKLLEQAGHTTPHVLAVAEWIELQEHLKEEHDRFVMLAAFKPDTDMNRIMTSRRTILLNHFGDDLTRAARHGYIPPMSGRETELEQLLQLFESGAHSVVITGDPGVGKTTLIEALARRMVEERVPRVLYDKRLISVNVAQLVVEGEAVAVPDRVLRLLQEAAVSGNIILVLEGIEALVGIGTSGPFDLAEIIATELERLPIYLIATTTRQAWTAHLERRTLGSKSALLSLPEPKPEEAIRMLMIKSGHIEYKQNVFFSYAALEACVRFANRYLQEWRLPESAIRMAEEAAAGVRRARGERAFVATEDIAKLIHQKTGIPVETVTRNESQILLRLEEVLQRRVIGQGEAVQAVAQAIRRARADVRDRKRPIANLLFLGPTGVGKTELAKALAAEYFGSEEAMVRLDMSEYQLPSAVHRVIGAPGEAQGGLLTEAVRRKPFCLVLLDELEKAHADVLTLFLQVMDDGRLTDGVGRTVDFTNTLLIATSNAATDFIQQAVKSNQTMEAIRTALFERELHNVFRPEFLNRFDGIMVFKPLTMPEVIKVARLLLAGLRKRLEEKGITLEIAEEMVERVAQQGFDPLFGARPLRRVIQEKVETQIADYLLRGEVQRGDTVYWGSDGRWEIKKATLMSEG